MFYPIVFKKITMKMYKKNFKNVYNKSIGLCLKQVLFTMINNLKLIENKKNIFKYFMFF